MKKLTLLSMLALVSAANANHNGFYVGLGLGGAFTNHAFNQDTATETAVKVIRGFNDFYGKKSSKMKFTAGLFGGYRWKFINGFTLGAELSLYGIFGKQIAERANGTVPNSVIAYAEVLNDRFTAAQRTAIAAIAAPNIKTGTILKRTFAFTVAPQVGFSVSPCFFVYGEFGLGMAWNKTALYVEGYADDVSGKSKTQFIMSPGVGVDYKFSSNVCVGLKYNYEFSTKRNYADAPLVADCKSSNHIVQLRVAYAF